MAGFAANTTVTYTFNGADQLTQVTSSQSGVVARFTYDGDHLRATKTVGSATVIYVRGPSGEVIAEYSGTGQLLAEYVYLDGQRVCKITTDGQGVEHRVYYHSDIVGTPVALTDEAGQLIAKAEYLPFGEEVVQGAAPDVHKFTGKELDDEIGLYDFGARYYDARLGRFISVDPVAGTNDDPQSWNRYAYGRDNPLRFVDPDGKVLAIASQNAAATLQIVDALDRIGATAPRLRELIGRLRASENVHTIVPTEEVEGEVVPLSGEAAMNGAGTGSWAYVSLGDIDFPSLLTHELSHSEDMDTGTLNFEAECDGCASKTESKAVRMQNLLPEMRAKPRTEWGGYPVRNPTTTPSEVRGKPAIKEPVRIPPQPPSPDRQ